MATIQESRKPFWEKVRTAFAEDELIKGECVRALLVSSNIRDNVQPRDRKDKPLLTSGLDFHSTLHRLMNVVFL